MAFLASRWWTDPPWLMSRVLTSCRYPWVPKGYALLPSKWAVPTMLIAGRIQMIPRQEQTSKQTSHKFQVGMTSPVCWGTQAQSGAGTERMLRQHRGSCLAPKPSPSSQLATHMLAAWQKMAACGVGICMAHRCRCHSQQASHRGCK